MSTTRPVSTGRTKPPGQTTPQPAPNHVRLARPHLEMKQQTGNDPEPVAVAPFGIASSLPCEVA